jgi:hypothetical protein
MADFPDVTTGGQLRVGTGIAPAIGEGNKKINGSMCAEGPVVFGNPAHFPTAYATVMIGPLANSDPDSVPPNIPGSLCQPVSNPYALCVSDNAGIMGNLDVNFRLQAGRDIVAGGNIISNCGAHILAAKKNFDIPHPTKEGWRLRHTCPEGPSNDVYYRGRVTNKKEITLPSYWENLVDPTTITVNLTPIGAHQNVIVKRISDNKVHLQSHGNMPIDCYYHIYGTRADGERLIPEYEGESPADYPGNNDEYSVSGFHYDVRKED